MDFYTAILRKSGLYRVALCLENGIVGQGYTRGKRLLSLKAKQHIRLLEFGGCNFHSEGKGDYKLYVRHVK